MMKKLQISQALPLMEPYGRTYADNENGVLYFNWTCGGFEVRFTGVYLAARLHAIPDQHPVIHSGPAPGETRTETVPDWPWLLVLVDDVPSRKIPLNGEEDTLLLYQSEAIETHMIRVVKLNENFRTFVGISTLYMDGEMEQFRRENRKRIEFVGDSITCGYGNGTNDPSRPFFTEEENGWMSHGAIAARELGMKPAFVSVSGITTTQYPDLPMPYSMDEVYPYTDRLLQDRLGMGTCLEKWDFSQNHSDYVVVNLGTNDAAAIVLSKDRAAAEAYFEKKYRSFLEMLRTQNGSDTHIVCALGSIDYYLFANIARIVNKIAEETKNPRISLLRYTKMMFVGDDVGAGNHPSVSMHQKMASELVEHIRKLERAEEGE